MNRCRQIDKVSVYLLFIEIQRDNTLYYPFRVVLFIILPTTINMYKRLSGVRYSGGYCIVSFLPFLFP